MSSKRPCALPRRRPTACAQLAEDLLLIARADQGALPIRAERVRVDELFSTMGERFSRRAGERGQPVDAPSDERIG